MAKRKASANNKPPTKSEIFSAISEKTDLPKRDVAAVFEELEPIIKKSLKSNGVFALPGICKMVVRKKPAVKAHTRPDPFNPGQMMQVKAKPASKTVKIRPLKKLKEMV